MSKPVKSLFFCLNLDCLPLSLESGISGGQGASILIIMLHQDSFSLMQLRALFGFV